MGKCIHHWDLGVSHKGVVHAVCRKCKAENDYINVPVYRAKTFGSKNKSVQPSMSQAVKTPN